MEIWGLFHSGVGKQGREWKGLGRVFALCLIKGDTRAAGCPFGCPFCSHLWSPNMMLPLQGDSSARMEAVVYQTLSCDSVSTGHFRSGPVPKTV
jgi:hypothetical protein